jgi:hypothetical protein
MSSKHWSWAYFFTDGLLFRNNNSYKNAWCIACLNHHKDQLREADIIGAAISGTSGDRTDGQREAQGSLSQIELMRTLQLLFHIARINSPPISGKPGQTMVPHLSKCVFVTPDVKNRAIDEINEKKIRATAGGGQNPPMLGRSVSMPLPAIAFPGSDQLPYQTALSATPSPVPSPLLLSAAPLVAFGRPSKRPRTSSFNPESSGSSSPVTRVWNSLLQQEFGEDFCKLLIAIRSSWNTAQNPQVHLFVDKWIPGAIVPDRRTLSGPILDREAGKVEEKLKLTLKGRAATFQTDGWKNAAKQAIVATMVSVDFEVCTDFARLHAVTDTSLP